MNLLIMFGGTIFDLVCRATAALPLALRGLGARELAALVEYTNAEAYPATCLAGTVRGAAMVEAARRFAESYGHTLVCAMTTNNPEPPTPADA